MGVANNSHLRLSGKDCGENAVRKICASILHFKRTVSAEKSVRVFFCTWKAISRRCFVVQMAPLCPQSWILETPSQGPLPIPTPVSYTLRSSAETWDVFTYASQGEKDEEHRKKNFGWPKWSMDMGVRWAIEMATLMGRLELLLGLLSINMCATLCLKQQKKTTCIKCLSGSLMSKEYPPPKALRTPICGFLRVPAVFCENQRFPNALFSGKRREPARISENQRKSAFGLGFVTLGSSP